MIALVLSLVACVAVECSSAPLGSCDTVETCCTTTDCYYETDGEVFECSGVDCNDAALELADYCTDGTSA